jgi:hypothetical protein
MPLRARVASVLSLMFVLSAIPALAQDVRPDQTIAVLASSAPGAPTADDLVEYYRSSNIAPPPLQSLSAENPLKIAYLRRYAGTPIRQ